MRFHLVTVLRSTPPRMAAGVYAANLFRVVETQALTDTTTTVYYDMGASIPVRVQANGAKATLDAILDVQFPDSSFPLTVLTKDGLTINKEETIRASSVVVAFENPDDEDTTMLLMLPPYSEKMERWVVDMPLVTVGATVGFLNLMNTDMAGVVAATPTAAP